ncbi:hypothetical protein [Micromonospora sp. NPDC002717]|uniref:hypothetical protein n=1 Tax=Micromonospora sp. NPDC002717 TaxID=3154424 RepID=UPI0033324347
MAYALLVLGRDGDAARLDAGAEPYWKSLPGLLERPRLLIMESLRLRRTMIDFVCLFRAWRILSLIACLFSRMSGRPSRFRAGPWPSVMAVRATGPNPSPVSQPAYPGRDQSFISVGPHR